MNAPAKKRLGELLIDAGVIDETQLKAALGHQRHWGIRLGQALVDLKLATEHDVVKVLARKFGLEVARFDQLEAYAHQQALSLIPRDLAAKHNVFPLAADTSTLSVAMSDPTNLAVVDELRFRTGRRVKVSIGGDREIVAAIQAAYPSPDGGVEAIALEIDEGGATGEPVLDSFGGGSSEDFDSFFGTEPAHAHGAEALPPAARPAPAASGAPPAAAPAAGVPPPARGPAATPGGPAAASPASPRPVQAAAQPPAQQAAQPPAARPATGQPARAPGGPVVRAVPAPPTAPPPAAVPAPGPSRPTPAQIRAVPQLATSARPAAPAGAPLTPGEQAVLSALQRLADGAHAEPEVLKPTQAIAAVIRILLRKGLVTERELLDALKKP